MAVDINEVVEMLKRQLDEWDRDGVLEERLREHGFEIREYVPEKPTAEKDSQ